MSQSEDGRQFIFFSPSLLIFPPAWSSFRLSGFFCWLLPRAEKTHQAAASQQLQLQKGNNEVKIRAAVGADGTSVQNGSSSRPELLHNLKFVSYAFSFKIKSVSLSLSFRLVKFSQ